MMRRTHCLALLGAAAILFWTGASYAAAPVAAPAVEVAPGAPGTRYQMQPAAAWCEGAKCWLLAWREGDVTEQKAEVWCARVAADGKALDPAGVRVAKADGMKERPAVASDGKSWLVAWSDLRNGKDWDVYAARVSADGKALDPDGFLVAGGEHCQAWPAVVFSGGNYLLVWQNFVPGVLSAKAKGYEGKFGSYEIQGARVSPEGKVLDAKALNIAPCTMIQPALAADGKDGLWLACVGRTDARVPVHGSGNGPATLGLDPASGAPKGKPSLIKPQGESEISTSHSVFPAMMMFPGKGGLLAVLGYRGGCTVFTLGPDGGRTGSARALQIKGREELDAQLSMAFDGERVLLTMEWLIAPGRLNPLPRTSVRGWVFSPEGKLLEGGTEGLVLAGDPNKDAVQGFACAGPKGAFLVAYCEPRGVDDTKVLARIVKN